MSVSGPSQQQNTQQQRNPYTPAIPYVDQIMQQGAGLYNSGAGSQVWQGPTVAGLNPWQLAGMGGIAATSAGLGGAGVPSFNYGYTPPQFLGAPTGGGMPLGGPAQWQGGNMGPGTPPILGGGGGAVENARGPGGSAMGYGGETVTPPQGAPNGGGVGMTGPFMQNQGVGAPLGGGMPDISGNSFTASNSATTNWSPYTGGPTAGAPVPGDVTGPGASMPWLYGLAAMGSNGLSPQMQGQLQNLAGIANGSQGITTGGLWQSLYGRALDQNNGANGVFNSIAGGADGITTGNQYGDVARAFSGPTQSETSLADMANAKDVNPYLKDVLAANDARIANRVNSAMSGAGRYGSAGHTDVLGRSLAESDNPILANAFEQGQNRALSAAQAIDNARNAAAGVRLGAIGGATGVQGQNLTNRLGAANSLVNSNNAAFNNAAAAAGGLTNVQGQNLANRISASNAGLGAMISGANNALGWANAAPNLAQLAYLPSLTQLGVGNFLQGQQQKELDNQRALFNQAQAMPWTQLGRYLQAVNGNSPLVGNSGTTTGQTITQTEIPFWQLFAGGQNSPASGLSGLGGTFANGLGNLFNPLAGAFSFGG
jgi:hypothetical protein